MAEWFKAAVLKTVGCNSPVGSNPTPSSNLESKLNVWVVMECKLSFVGSAAKMSYGIEGIFEDELVAYRTAEKLRRELPQDPPGTSTRIDVFNRPLIGKEPAKANQPVPLTYHNGLVDIGTDLEDRSYYQKDIYGYVRLYIAIQWLGQNGQFLSDTLIANLPPGYRPAKVLNTDCFKVWPNGDVSFAESVKAPKIRGYFKFLAEW